MLPSGVTHQTPSTAQPQCSCRTWFPWPRGCPRSQGAEPLVPRERVEEWHVGGMAGGCPRGQDPTTWQLAVQMLGMPPVRQRGRARQHGWSGRRGRGPVSVDGGIRGGPFNWLSDHNLPHTPPTIAAIPQRRASPFCLQRGRRCPPPPRLPQPDRLQSAPPTMAQPPPAGPLRPQPPAAPPHQPGLPLPNATAAAATSACTICGCDLTGQRLFHIVSWRPRRAPGAPPLPPHAPRYHRPPCRSAPAMLRVGLWQRHVAPPPATGSAPTAG